MSTPHPLAVLTELLHLNGFAVQLAASASPSPAPGVAYLVTTAAPLPTTGDLR